ncbi:MAG: LysM peptidoglycan-binding domain-containing protein [Gammaproteobacteria bacterium]|nr:LysM peptidoglycan-binding domain-containing protein [Gammaproteobacteria bacterium]
MSIVFKRVLILMVGAMVLTHSAGATDLPRPAGLEPDIAFWRQIFSEVNTQQALIHDNRRLEIVYERVDLPPTGGSKARRKFSEQRRNKYSKILDTLSRGKREGLTTEEARVLALWPEDVRNSELRDASERVRFQQGLSDQFLEGLIRSGRWQDYIANSLRKAGVPQQLAALPHVESSYNPNARSHVGASGLWQFTRSTGRRFMQIDHVIDERRDPYRSSESAAALLKYNYSILKSWPLAITAYNHGVGGMRRAQRVTGTNDIEVINRRYKGRAFGFASRNFYVAFLAAVEVSENAEQYFGEFYQDPAEETVTVSMREYVPVPALAKAFGVSRRTLQTYNPALLDVVWSGQKYVPQGYRVRLPADQVDESPRNLLAGVPGNQRFRRQTPDLEHKVRRGDSLSVIAVRYDTSVAKLMEINNLKSRHQIRAGQIIHLPNTQASRFGAIPAGADTYIVQPGDTLSGIAHRAGMRELELLALNSRVSSNRIYPGQKIRLSGQGKASPATVRRQPAPEPAKNAQAEEVTAEIVAAVVEEVPAPEETVAAIGVQTTDRSLQTDPGNYEVYEDGTIEIQAEETLGHYAAWLGVSTGQIRALNDFSKSQPVVIGRRLQLGFDQVSQQQFVAQRVAYHRQLQEAFFARYRIADTKVHKFRRGESLFVLSLREYKVPVWLLRQHNPDLDLDRIRPGTLIVIPELERTDPAKQQESVAVEV